MAVADFDSDGHQDLVSAGYPQLTIFRGNGNGDLGILDRAPGGEHPVDFSIADLDEDGKVDLVIADDASSRATVYLSVSQ